MSETATAVQERPAPEGYKSWHDYWKSQGMPWRSEPEIAEERQRYLAERQIIPADVGRGVYPFMGISLDRADVEWMLATLKDEFGEGPIVGKRAERQRRIGLDLRGTDLSKCSLRQLPLACMLGGLHPGEVADLDPSVQDAACEAAAVRLEGADLAGADLADAILTVARLDRACMADTHLECAYLWRAQLRHADLQRACLAGAALLEANLDGALAYGARLEGAEMSEVSLKRAVLGNAHLEGARLSRAHLEDSNLAEAHLEGADLERAHLEGASLVGAHLGGKSMSNDDLRRVRDSKPNFVATLPAASMCGCYFDSETNLQSAHFGDTNGSAVSLAGAHLNGVDLLPVAWDQVTMLGDERKARDAEESVQSGIRLYWFQLAVRSNLRLATALREQGLSEHANRFAYRALLCERAVARRQGKRMRYLGSLFLDLTSGYGYRPLNSVLTYFIVVLGFAAAYFVLGRAVGPHFSPGAALITSIVSFHGRGFFPQSVSLDDPIMWVVASEAIVGLLIEITFIATFTQRFFAR